MVGRMPKWFYSVVSLLTILVLLFAVYCGVCGVFALVTPDATWSSMFTTFCGVIGDPISVPVETELALTL